MHVMPFHERPAFRQGLAEPAHRALDHNRPGQRQAHATRRQVGHRVAAHDVQVIVRYTLCLPGETAEPLPVFR